MRSFLIAAAALAAVAVPAEPADAQRSRQHWQSGHPGMHHMRGQRQWNRHVWMNHRPMRGDFRHHRRFRGHPFVHHGGFRGHPFVHHRRFRGHPFPHHRRFRSHSGVVFFSGGFGSSFAFSSGFGGGCRSVWFDGWGWRCAW